MALADIVQALRKVNARKADIVRVLATDSKRSFWAIADQGVASIGNFGINILLGWYFHRQGDLTSFASFWILMELILFLNGLQAALVVYPLSVRGAISGRGLGILTSMSIVLTILAWPVLA